MAILRVSLGFAQAADHGLEETTGAVLADLYKEAAVFPEPSVAAPNLKAALDHFAAASADASKGGEQATAAREQAREALILLLRKLAGYVQGIVQGPPALGLAELLSSGFDAVSTNRAQQPLPKAHIVRIDNSGAGQLTLRVGAVRNARNYEVQHQTVPNPALPAPAGGSAPGPWVSAGLYNSTRGMIVTGLTPGQMYGFRVRAIGGATGSGDWSDVVSHMSL